MDFDALLQLVVHKKASDLFITSGWAPSIKVNGVLQQVSKTRLSANQAMEVVKSVMSDAQRQEFEETKECQFAISRPEIGRFRVSAFIQKDDAGMVLRRIETQIPTIAELNIPLIIEELAMTKRGLIIFVGATGTGKSTSLAAMVGHRNRTAPDISSPLKTRSNTCMITRVV